MLYMLLSIAISKVSTMSDFLTNYGRLIKELDEKTIEGGEYSSNNPLFNETRNTVSCILGRLAGMDARGCKRHTSMNARFCSCRREILTKMDETKEFLHTKASEYKYAKVGVGLDGSCPEEKNGVPFTGLTFDDFDAICNKNCFIKAVVLKVSKIIVVFYFTKEEGSYELTGQLYAALKKVVCRD